MTVDALQLERLGAYAGGVFMLVGPGDVTPDVIAEARRQWQLGYPKSHGVALPVGWKLERIPTVSNIIVAGDLGLSAALAKRLQSSKVIS